MSILEEVIKDKEKALYVEIDTSDWYHKKLKECEIKILGLKEMIAQLKTLAQEGK